MFMSISCTGREVDYKTKSYILLYTLEDTEFTIALNVPIETHIYDNRGDASIIPSGLTSIYQKYKKNVPKNLALFYTKTGSNLPIPEQNKLLHLDRLWTDKYFPDLEYSKKYFRCIINQMNVLHYTGVTNNAQPVTRPIL
jgi:hypothetical protein